MTSHKTGTREEWLAARLDLLEAEKALTRRTDDVAWQRQELPWVSIGKQYRFDTDEGSASLADLFQGRSQLLLYHFMFGPDYTAGCPSCSAIADGFSGSVVHLAHHDVTLTASERRMRWRCRQRTAPSAALMVAMIAPPSVMEMNERRKPVPKNRRRIQASARSSNAITASASSTAAPAAAGTIAGRAARM